MPATTRSKLKELTRRTTMDQPFRFLDLPMELRLMVYERIPATNQHLKVHSPFTLNAFEPWIAVAPIFSPQVFIDDWQTLLPVTFVLPKISNAIRATCQLINDEARDMIANRNQNIILEEVKIMMDATHWWRSLNFTTLIGPNRLKSQFKDETENDRAKLSSYEAAYARMMRLNQSTPISISIHGSLDDWSVGYPQVESLIMSIEPHPRHGPHSLVVKLGTAGPQYFADEHERKRCQNLIYSTEKFTKKENNPQRDILMSPKVAIRYAEAVQGAAVERWKDDWEEDKWFAQR